MKVCSLLIIFFFCFNSALAQGEQTDREKFLGRWIDAEGMQLIFHSDGTALIDRDNVQWKVKPGLLLLTTDGTTETYQYIFNAQGLRVSGGNLEKPLQFRKITSDTSPKAKTSKGSE